MPHNLTSQQLSDFEALHSPPRFATYLRETQGDRIRAAELCIWNTEISAAFYIILQYCEVAVRNAAVEAIEAEFGPNWHLNRGFRHVLAPAKGRYSPQKDLQNCANAHATAGKVVAELKFAFWQYLFVKGLDGRLWTPHFDTIFPGYDTSLSIKDARARVHSDLEIIRHFRNRIAHHEPIFARNLVEDRDRILNLVGWRRPSLSAWMQQFDRVSPLLQVRL